VASTGEVSQGDQPKGKMRLVEFNQPHSLTAMGQGYFLADQPGVLPGMASLSSVRQGFLEASNTSPTAEMANLIISMRMFEANAKVLQTQDDHMGRVISDLGNPS
jgi:flagellar basal-body rod protein FlgG